jgi:hypothetical protein
MRPAGIHSFYVLTISTPTLAEMKGLAAILDLIAVVDRAAETFERRSSRWDLNTLPVPTELIVYTRMGWKRLQKQGRDFARMLNGQVVWICPGN